MYPQKGNNGEVCPVETTVKMVGGKWKILILHDLAVHEVMRFNELKRRLGAITHKTLTQQLRELEADELVTRTVYAEVPPKVEYTLSATGRSLIPILQSVEKWGTAYLQQKRDSAHAQIQ